MIKIEKASIYLSSTKQLHKVQTPEALSTVMDEASEECSSSKWATWRILNGSMDAGKGKGDEYSIQSG